MFRSVGSAALAAAVVLSGTASARLGWAQPLEAEEPVETTGPADESETGEAPEAGEAAEPGEAAAAGESVEPETAAPTEPELPELSAAKEAIDQVQFEEAVRLLENARRSGKAKPRELREILRLIGESSVAIGQNDKATDAFKALACLEPDVTLGEMVSPKIVEVLEAAKASLEGQRLAAEHQHDVAGRSVSIHVSSDPLAMVGGMRLVYRRRNGIEAVLSAALQDGRGQLDIPNQSTGTVQVQLLDSHGNQLVSWQLEVEAVAAAVGAETASGGSEQELWERWWVWAGAAGVVAATGAGFALASTSAQSDLDVILANPSGHFFSDAKALEDKARTRATLANVSFALAAGLGAASAYFFYRGLQGEGELQVQPVVDDKGAALMLGGRF